MLSQDASAVLSPVSLAAEKMENSGSRVLHGKQGNEAHGKALKEVHEEGSVLPKEWHCLGEEIHSIGRKFYDVTLQSVLTGQQVSPGY